MGSRRAVEASTLMHINTALLLGAVVVSIIISLLISAAVHRCSGREYCTAIC